MHSRLNSEAQVSIGHRLVALPVPQGRTNYQDECANCSGHEFLKQKGVRLRNRYHVEGGALLFLFLRASRNRTFIGMLSDTRKADIN